LIDVLAIFVGAFQDGTELHGWAIMKATKRSGPTVYGVLDRLEEIEWITGRWEDENPNPSKPRRRFYRLTSAGAAGAMEILRERRPQGLRRDFSPAPRLGLPSWIGSLRHGDLT
jgi:DNA-binding PadR family transcriptional regulator